MIIWIRTHVATGDVTIHKNPPRPRSKDETPTETINRDGETITNYCGPDGSIRHVWVETYLHD